MSHFPILKCATPHAWVEYAVDHLPDLLRDHANCERKAAKFAMSLLNHFNSIDVRKTLSQLAREELNHYERVLSFMKKRKIEFSFLKASRYAKALRQAVDTDKRYQLLDQLIISAFIEARSCERFEALAPVLGDHELQRFYGRLAVAERRHYEIYLDLASNTSFDLTPRIEFFAQIECDLIQSNDDAFHFHSGNPSKALRHSTEDVL